MSYEIALTGINAAEQDLAVISNNIANVNSAGFKRARAEFSALVGASQEGASSSDAGRGTQLSSITQIFDQGNIITTNGALDIALNGGGFFTLSDAGAPVYSRNGQFHVDKDGFVVNASGDRLQAFQPDTTGTVTSTVDDLLISTADSAPLASTEVTVSLNLDANDVPTGLPFDLNDPLTYNSSTSLTIFDSLGVEHTATLYFVNSAPGQWDSYTAIDGVQIGGATALQFDGAGILTLPAPGTITVPYTPANGAAAQSIDFDLSTSTQFGSGFNVNELSQNGYTTGRLVGIDVSSDGLVQARYTNGQIAIQGQLALANFANPLALSEVGNTNWAETSDSGPALIGAPGTASLGLLISGALEESNVDLTEMLVELINAQRNFQANAKTIETSDAVTETVINLT